MNIAVSGDRGSCLTLELATGIELFGVAHGCGAIDGTPAARFAIERVRAEFTRRSAALQRDRSHPKSIGGMILNALAHVNSDAHVRSASHEDYVTAACSLTVALVVNGRAYVAHAGTTAAYLLRGGSLIVLTKEDAISEEGALPVLMRSIGTQARLEVAVCSFGLSDGDALILAGRRLRPDLSRLNAQRPGEQFIVIRYEAIEHSEVAPPPRNATLAGALRTAALVTSILALLTLH